MPYGLPCPSDPQPEDVFKYVEELDSVLGQLAGQIMSSLLDDKNSMSGLIGPSVETLTSGVKKLVRKSNDLLDVIIKLLLAQYASTTFLFNVNFQTLLQSISETTGLSIEELLSGPYPPRPAPPIFPPPSSPTGPPLPPPPPQFPITLVVGGVPVQVFPVCNPVQLGSSISIGGNVYAPTATAFSTGGTITLAQDGSPIISVGYDPQPDGSVVVNVGPLAIKIDLPPADPTLNIPACPLDVAAA